MCATQRSRARTWSRGAEAAEQSKQQTGMHASRSRAGAEAEQSTSRAGAEEEHAAEAEQR